MKYFVRREGGNIEVLGNVYAVGIADGDSEVMLAFSGAAIPGIHLRGNATLTVRPISTNVVHVSSEQGRIGEVQPPQGPKRSARELPPN